MKTIIIAIATFFITTTGLCQFYPSPELDMYIGTWKWGSGNDSVIVVLQKQITHNRYDPNEATEELIGWHKYIKNGQVKESNLQYTGSSYDAGRAANNIKSSINGYWARAGSLHLDFFDLTLHKGCEVAWNLLPGSTTQAQWILKERRGLYLGPPDTYTLFTLPRNIILTKQ